MFQLFLLNILFNWSAYWLRWRTQDIPCEATAGIFDYILYCFYIAREAAILLAWPDHVHHSSKIFFDTYIWYTIVGSWLYIVIALHLDILLLIGALRGVGLSTSTGYLVKLELYIEIFFLIFFLLNR
jgi:hypothetical protein